MGSRQRPGAVDECILCFQMCTNVVKGQTASHEVRDVYASSMHARLAIYRYCTLRFLLQYSES